MTKLLLSLVLVAFAAYGLVEAWPILSGPSLSVTAPLDGASVQGGIVSVRGSVAHVALLTLDGAPVLRDEEGRFSSTLTLPRGTSILTFMAADRFGRHVTATRTVFIP